MTMNEMKEAILSYIRGKLGHIQLNNREDPFSETTTDNSGSNIQIGELQFNVQRNVSYPMGTNKKCDRLLKSSKSGNSGINIWIEGKMDVKLLPINCCYIPEKIILGNDSSFLDIARLIALVNNPNDIRFTISTVNSEIFEYYKRRLSLSKTKENNGKIQIESNFISNFICSDVLPVENSRKKIVQLYYEAILDSYFLNLGKDKYVVISFVNHGWISLKVYRDIDNPSFEGSKCCYEWGHSNNDVFLNNYFPSS